MNADYRDFPYKFAKLYGDDFVPCIYVCNNRNKKQMFEFGICQIHYASIKNMGRLIVCGPNIFGGAVQVKLNAIVDETHPKMAFKPNQWILLDELVNDFKLHKDKICDGIVAELKRQISKTLKAEKCKSENPKVTAGILDPYCNPNFVDIMPISSFEEFYVNIDLALGAAK